jgi:hypothetical protein
MTVNESNNQIKKNGERTQEGNSEDRSKSD